MAVVPAVYSPLVKGVFEITWANMANGDTGAPVSYPNYPDKTITVRGTPGAGGSISIKGTDSADATAVTGWDVLSDTRGDTNNMTFGGRDTRALLENPAQVAPHVTAGDGTTSFTVVMLCTSTLR